MRRWPAVSGWNASHELTSPAVNRWSWTALSFRTGRRVWSRANGDGLGYNNNYAGIALNRKGVAYLGVLGGITALRDG